MKTTIEITMYGLVISFAIFFFSAVILAAHFFTPSIYHWTTNTISDLAAQNYNNAWIMRAGFIGFGILLNTGILLKFYQAKSINPADILVMLYGLAILLSGIFSAAPFDGSTDYSLIADKLHSICAQTAGTALSIGVLVYLLSAHGNIKLFHLLFLILIIGISALFGLSKNGIINIDYGIIQRSLYLVSFLWLLLIYNVKIYKI